MHNFVKELLSVHLIIVCSVLCGTLNSDNFKRQQLCHWANLKESNDQNYFVYNPGIKYVMVTTQVEKEGFMSKYCI